MNPNTFCRETQRLLKIQTLLKEQRMLEYRIQEISEEHFKSILKLNEMIQEIQEEHLKSQQKLNEINKNLERYKKHPL